MSTTKQYKDSPVPPRWQEWNNIQAKRRPPTRKHFVTDINGSALGSTHPIEQPAIDPIQAAHQSEIMKGKMQQNIHDIKHNQDNSEYQAPPAGLVEKIPTSHLPPKAEPVKKREYDNILL